MSEASLSSVPQVITATEAPVTDLHLVIDPGAPPEPVSSRRNTVIVPLIIGIALFMQMLDSVILSNALPSIARAFNESPVALNLAITSYLLAAAIFLPISGWAADRFGARPVFVIAIIGFAASSLFCGMANDLPMLVLARFAQGCAGAMMLPVGRVVILKTVPKSELVDAMALFTMPAILGPVLGPPLGGFIVTYGSWRWIFYLNIPIAVLGVIMVAIFVPDVREEEKTPLDVRGFILASLSLAGLVFGFENLGRSLLPLWLAVTLVLVGAVCVSLFTLHAKRAKYPILHLPLFKTSTFVSGTVGGLFPRLSLGANSFLMALLLQIGFGMTAFQAGLTTFTGALGALAMKATAPPIIRRLGFKRVLVFNTLVSAVIFMSYSLFTASTSHILISAVLLIGGFFNSLQFTALNALTYSDVDHPMMSRASTLASMTQQLAISLGVGLAAVVVEILQGMAHSDALTSAQISPAFVIIGAIGPISLFYFLRLSNDAGAEVSGHGIERVEPAE